ncbi:Hepatocyte growth factor-regulated tyrosine kinase substrate [Amphibalanus amphitrite]|uniref:Hepatocyte growth factor-regulated tyrosine kinase substrate n=1 Tax=Amphibalanus amphitrite TaxID=1232801 RepID=A0A6A4WSE1_AMPAM|nr:Hepatocyte growth factor-regulated tyrosine kinase substrate [Amphibalanus amphitrite]
MKPGLSRDLGPFPSLSNLFYPTRAKYAVLATKKRLYHENPHVAVLALCVLEAMVKNCGSSVHDEIGQLGFMQEMRELVVKAPDIVKEKLLELLQTWAFAFRQTPKYRAVQDTVRVNARRGVQVPHAARVGRHVFVGDGAGVGRWRRCATGAATPSAHSPGSITAAPAAKCSASKCSSKTSNIPKFGIEREVRVCDSCFEQINRPGGGSGGGPSPKNKPAASSSTESDLPPEYLASPLSKQSQAPPARKSEEELKEEEELALALAISQSEAEAKDREKARGSRSYGGSPAPTSSGTGSSGGGGGGSLKSAMKRADAGSDRDPESDPELARYLNRSYWEARQEEPRSPPPSTAAAVSSSAPASTSSQSPATVTAESGGTEPKMVNETYQNGASDQQLDQFVATICSQLEIFVNRMKSNSSRGRPIANDSSVQTLFMNITAMHSQLLHNIQLQDDQRGENGERCTTRVCRTTWPRCETRALRWTPSAEEHRERLRREAEEAQRHRQMQMMQKLEIMRKKKQEYLQYQRQLALQRMQEQER